MTSNTILRRSAADRHALPAVRILVRSERILMRYGLALILLWIGAMKFTAYEANGIRGLEANSPFMKPFLDLLGTQGLSSVIGVIEIVTALLLVAGSLRPRAGVGGSVLAIGTFLTTLSLLSFMFTTPGWEPSLGGFPALSAGVGQFLVKDVVLLGAAVYTLRESATALQVPASN